jgi:hypothetical protein
VGEGVETCMAAETLGHKPAWALGSIGAISSARSRLSYWRPEPQLLRECLVQQGAL